MLITVLRFFQHRFEALPDQVCDDAVTGGDRMQSIRLGVFAHPCYPLQQKGKKIQIVLIGKLGINGFKWIEEAKH